MAAWNGDAQSNVNYVRGAASSAPFAVDGINSIHLDDAADTPGGFAVGFTRYNSRPQPLGGAELYVFDGAQMAATYDADVAIAPGLGTIAPGLSSQTFYEQVLTHELGHTLSLRHSDERVPQTFCGCDECNHHERTDFWSGAAAVGS